MVFQTGAWEFNYWPTRVVLNSSAQRLLRAIRSAKADGCGAYLSLVFVTAVPYPACETLTLHDPAVVGAVGVMSECECECGG